MTRIKRQPIPKSVETEVLTKSRRRCCLCYGLHGDISQKEGQIAHLDKNRSNNKPDNFAWLCFDHHNSYDSQSSQGKGLTEKEVKTILPNGSGYPASTTILRLTWPGHEFLDAARNETIWRKAGEHIKKSGVEVTLSLLQEILKQLAKQSLGLV